ncbi:MAG TPA: MOSC domain-containing protein [Thermoplasmata archaeon]|nr:MOSC domain-containing protein [Thermoplasmata archaeon]
MDGRVVALHRKPETAGERGLPKRAYEEVEVDRTGVKGDFNRYRVEVLHGDPDSAILLMPLETLQQLNREGWPVRHGDLGENITTEGLPYDTLRPGTKWRMGPAIVEVTRACTPCDNLYLLPYVGAEKGPQFLKVMLDRRGMYARVVSPGRIHVGDRIAPT